MHTTKALKNLSGSVVNLHCMYACTVLYVTQ